MIKVLVATFLLFNTIAYSQKSEPAEKKIKFTSVNQLGLLTGSSGSEATFQSINGVRKGKWFAGVGAAIDHYYFRSVPLFLDVQRGMLSKKNTPFVYVDAGINFPWLTTSQKNMKGPTTYDEGGYYEGGIGWKLKGKNDRAFIFSAGYSFKQVKEVVTAGWWWGGPRPMEEPPTERYDNRLNRVVIKIGCQL